MKGRIGNHKGFLGYILLLILLFVSPFAQAQEKVLPVGGLFALTGAGASYGAQMGSGIELWVDRVNDAGGINGVKINLLMCDHKGIPKEGVNCATRLIHYDKVPMLFSSYSALTLAVMPVAEKSKVFVLNGGAGAPALINASPYLFNNMVNYGVDLFIDIGYAWNKGARRLAFFGWNEEAGLWTAEHGKKLWEKRGGVVVESQFIAPGAVDMRSQVSKVKAAKPDAVIMNMGGMDAAMAFNEMHKQGLGDVLKLGFGHWELPEILKVSKGASEGIIFPMPLWDISNPTNEEAKKFIEAYRKKYNKDPAMYSANFYEAGMILGQIISYLHSHNKELTGENMRDTVVQVKTFDSIFGKVVFREGGIVIKRMAIKTVKDEKFVTLKTLSEKEAVDLIE